MLIMLLLTIGLIVGIYKLYKSIIESIKLHKKHLKIKNYEHINDSISIKYCNVISNTEI